MTNLILVDTGPIVAILSKSDRHHKECVETLKTLAPPLITTWPVITEVAWLLRRNPYALKRFLSSFEEGLLELAEVDAASLASIGAFLVRYRTIGAQLADASLVLLAESRGLSTIFTLDRRDFSVYRIKKNKFLTIIP